MLRFDRILALASLALVAAPAAAGPAPASSPPSTVQGAWRKIAPAPFAVPQSVSSVWTGKQLIVFGRRPPTNPSVEVAEAYDPAADAWTVLSPPPGPDYVPGYDAVWTGKEMLVFGAFHSVAYRPATGSWRELPRSVPGGIVVWSGREAIGWGGGCCGDAQANGIAYDPAAGRYRNLPRSPLAPEQRPLGAWTGRELVLFVSGINPADGRPWPARLARAAAYDPQASTWRRIPPLPVRFGGTAVWDGREVLVAGAGPQARSALAFDPVTSRWRKLASLPAPRLGATALWTGSRLVLWGGQNLAASVPGGLRDGLLYDPSRDRWSTIPKAPLRASGSAVAWTGRSLLVWGGEIGGTKPSFPRAGAAFTPVRR